MQLASITDVSVHISVSTFLRDTGLSNPTTFAKCRQKMACLSRWRWDKPMVYFDESTDSLHFLCRKSLIFGFVDGSVLSIPWNEFVFDKNLLDLKVRTYLAAHGALNEF